jgi:hypothetical protein
VNFRAVEAQKLLAGGWLIRPMVTPDRGTTAGHGRLLIADHDFIGDRAVAVEMVDDRHF